MRLCFPTPLSRRHDRFAVTALAGAVALATAIAPAAEPAHEVLIRGARVIDGSGAPAMVANVAFRDGRISHVGTEAVPAKRIIEGRGLVLTPGFVDLHSHADRDIRTRRDAENYVRQGVTTLVVGNCGGSPTDATAFFRSLHEEGAGVNIVLLIGHGSVRIASMGDRAAAPSAEELASMRRRVAAMMEAGAAGLSTGLRYRPGAYAEMSEVLAVTREIAPYGGFYATHMRDEGVRIEAALVEALHIGREAGVPVHIAHHKISSASVWGLTRQTLAQIDQARAAGMDVTLDQYPYGAGSSGMSLMVPQPLVAGGSHAFLQRIADPKVRNETLAFVEAEIREKMFEQVDDVRNPARLRAALARIQVARLAEDTRIEGLNLVEILELRETPLSLRAGAELVVELVSRGASAIYHTIDDRPGGDVDRVMRHPQTSIASDGILPGFGEGHPHPRSYGTYPRVLAHYVRERGVLSWEEAIHKMTGLPARRLGWSDRGLIQVGHRADAVLFDPERIRDTATFTQPHAHAEGVSFVWIRGEAVLAEGVMTGRRPGRPVYSVPSPATPEARLRQDVLERVGRFDVRCGILAVDTNGREVFAFNADDRFFLGPATALEGENAPTLREAVGRGGAQAAAPAVYRRRHPMGDGRIDLVVWARVESGVARGLRMTAAFASLREADADAGEELVRHALIERLARHAANR